LKVDKLTVENGIKNITFINSPIHETYKANGSIVVLDHTNERNKLITDERIAEETA